MHTIDREIPIQYDESTRTYRLSHDWRSDHSVSTAIVLAVGEITETPQIDIEPLYEVVDPDALDTLYSQTDNPTLRRDGSVFFRFHDCGVTVHSTGEIEIRSLDGADDAASTDRR